MLTVLVIATSCGDNVGGIFRLRNDSPMPSWLVLPAGVSPNDITITLTEYEATTTQWKVRFIIKEKKDGRVLREAIGYGYWHPDSEREKAPASTYPNWVIIDVNGAKDVYEQSEHLSPMVQILFPKLIR